MRYEFGTQEIRKYETTERKFLSSRANPSRNKNESESMKLSVILCTHNPHRGRLDRTLEGLKKQTLALSDWKFILVDNASAPALDGTIDLSWHPHGQLVCEAEFLASLVDRPQ